MSETRKRLLIPGAILVVLMLLTSVALVVTPDRVPVETRSSVIEGTPRTASFGTTVAPGPSDRFLGEGSETTYATTGPRWTNLTGPVSPPPANYIGAAYDVIDHYLITFGGQDASAQPTNQTWAWDNGTWTNLTASAGPAPVARMGMALTLDPIDGYVLAYGGGDFFVSCGSTRATACNSTWTFHSGKWQVLPTAGPSPPVSMQLGMVYDAADGYIVASDGFSTWKFVGGTWTELCGVAGNCSNPVPHPPRFAGVMAYDSQVGKVVYFGDASTWEFSGGNWTNVTSTSGAPPPSGLGSMMTDDPATGSVLYFGGCGGGCNSVEFTRLNYTWSFSGGTWTNITPVASPPGRYAGALAYDPDASVVVLFGGNTQLGAGGNLNDTWVWGVSPPIGELIPSVIPSTPLPGSTAAFAESFKGGVSPFNYTWRFGDGNASTLADPTHVFAKVGTYRVGLWVNDSGGHQAYTSFQVHVYVALSVGLTASPNPATLGEPVNFTAAAVGGTPPYAFAWAFGDGGTGGNLSNITHIFTTNGPFTTEVMVSDLAGGVAQGYLNVSIRLQALAAASASSGASPLAVSFLGQAQGGVPPYTYSWNFGDGGSSSTQDPHHIYNSSGKFDAVLTVTDSRQNHSTTSLVIQVGGGEGSSNWYFEFVGAAVLAAGVSGLWVGVWARQRTRRRQGEKWVRELTSANKVDESKSP